MASSLTSTLLNLNGVNLYSGSSGTIAVLSGEIATSSYTRLSGSIGTCYAIRVSGRTSNLSGSFSSGTWVGCISWGDEDVINLNHFDSTAILGSSFSLKFKGDSGTPVIGSGLFIRVS